MLTPSERVDAKEALQPFYARAESLALDVMERDGIRKRPASILIEALKAIVYELEREAAGPKTDNRVAAYRASIKLIDNVDGRNNTSILAEAPERVYKGVAEIFAAMQALAEEAHKCGADDPRFPPECRADAIRLKEHHLRSRLAAGGGRTRFFVRYYNAQQTIYYQMIATIRRAHDADAAPTGCNNS